MRAVCEVPEGFFSSSSLSSRSSVEVANSIVLPSLSLFSQRADEVGTTRGRDRVKTQKDSSMGSRLCRTPCGEACLTVTKLKISRGSAAFYPGEACLTGLQNIGYFIENNLNRARRSLTQAEAAEPQFNLRYTSR